MCGLVETNSRFYTAIWFLLQACNDCVIRMIFMLDSFYGGLLVSHFPGNAALSLSSSVVACEMYMQ